ncbi:MAG TPA: FecR family protein, partial [Candidatus Sulfopaludibacter sp.]|nr:FecR family protein [Candidatus Sulfopaludibacter sp.]
LAPARALLLKDHLHECVVCRKVYEGRVTTMPAPRPAAARRMHTVRWVAMAAAVAAAGIYIWVGVDGRTGTGRAIVQTVNGSLFEITAEGIRPLAAGQALPDGVEIRTAKDSDAMLQLRDGSVVELRERSGLNTAQNAADLTIRLSQGSIIVQAAKRRTGHLYVDTADCHVAVTGTVFGVSAGIKGSRVSVVQGEVHVTHDNQETVLHPGGQTVTSAEVEPKPVREDIAWSRNRDRYYSLLAAIREGIGQLHLPELRYSSKLLGRLPASTAFYAAIPNLEQYLGDAESVFRQKAAASPELSTLWSGKAAGVMPLVDKLRAASAYLGDEIVVVMLAGPDGGMTAPVVLAEVKKDGFPEFLKQAGVPLAHELRNGMVVLGPDRAAVEQVAPALDNVAGSFQGTPFYARIAQAYADGAGLLLCADLSRMGSAAHLPLAGVRYVIAEQKEVNHQMEARASVGFDGSRTGIAGWLAEPAPMGSLEYVSPDATFVASFIARDAGATMDALTGMLNRSAADLGPKGVELRDSLGSSLSGEFTLAVDGPLFPVPSWKLVAEVYDAARMQAGLQAAVDAYNEAAVTQGGKPLRTSQETVEGHVIYMIAGGNPNPLTEAHYTFSGGYFIAGPSRALVMRALQVKAGGASIQRSSKFLALAPRDQYVNFSAVVFENFGTTLAPLAGLAGAFMPNLRAEQQKGLQKLGNLKPLLYAAYAEPDRMTIAGSDNVLGSSLSNLMTGNLGGIVGGALPLKQFAGAGR